MLLKDLAERGYFPKELPPPYNTKLLADKINLISSSWNTVFTANTDTKNTDVGLVQDATSNESNSQFKERKREYATGFINQYGSSRPCDFSISKGKLSRRYLRIPNPKHFGLLAAKIVSNWVKFDLIFKQSEFSASYPVPETDINKRAVNTSSNSVADFRNRLLSCSFNKTVEVRVDISKFYPTIYTHSITWAFLGKEEAKKFFKQKDTIKSLIANGDTNALLYSIADDIDNIVRAGQERQSIGIAIGPDTSHIIAELIACRIDMQLKDEFGNLNFKACRYYDDYYIYVSSRDEADKILKGLQRILVEFQLEINEGKIKIKEFPFSFEDEYSTVIHQYQFKETNFDNSLRHYFSIIWGLAEKNPTKADTIFKYALRTFEYRTIEITKNSWKLFEALLFKTALIEPSILDIVTRILLSYPQYMDGLSKERLKELVTIVIENHSEIKHNFEVSWVLWIAKTFEVEISEHLANKVISSRDPISILILLDIYKSTGLGTGMPNWNVIENELKEGVLFSELWLLAYEAIIKGWLTPSTPNLLDDNLYFKLLKNEDVSFYDANRQLKIYQKIDKKPKVSGEGYCCTKIVSKEPEIYPSSNEPQPKEEEKTMKPPTQIEFITSISNL